MSAGEAALLFGLFVVQFAVPNTEFRLFMSGVYLVLAAGIFIRNRREAVALVHHARTAHLEESEGHA
jgi:cation:H+ antiporter